MTFDLSCFFFFFFCKRYGGFTTTGWARTDHWRFDASEESLDLSGLIIRVLAVNGCIWIGVSELNSSSLFF